MSRRIKLSACAARMTDDLVMEILARLPTKSLRRFQCVSKAWSSFISELYSRRRVLLPMSGLFFYTHVLPTDPIHGKYASIISDHQQHEEDRRAFMAFLATLPFYSTSYVIHSCNGLLLFRRKSPWGAPDFYFVCNPTTMEFVALPVQSIPGWDSVCFLAFDPLESPHFKVVRFRWQRGGIIIVYVYSSLTGNWVELVLLRHERPSFHCWDFMAVFRKGALYMLAFPNYLLRYDVERGNFEMLLLPVELPELKGPMTCLGDSRGHIYFAIHFCPRFELQIWMLDEANANKWLMKHRIGTKFFDKHPLMTPDPWYGETKPSRTLRPIAFHPDSDVIYLSIPGKILSYHPSCRRVEEVCKVTDYKEIVDWMSTFPVIPCRESINPPGGKCIPC